MQILERYLGSNVASDIVKIYYGAEQVYPLGVNVIAGSGDLTITAFVPSMGVEIPLNVNDLTFEGFAGVGEISSFSGLGGVTLQGFAAALGVDINVTSGSVTINGLAPDSEILTTSGVGAITVTGFAATVDTGSTLLNGLVSQYNFNESSGNLLDQVGSNDGTVVGATQNGSEYVFDGVNDYVNVPADASINNLAQADMSLSVWVKPDTSTPSLARRFASKRGGASNHGWIFYQDTSNKVAFTTITSGTNATANGTTSINTNAWYHVVAVYDQSGRSVKIYVNGVDETTSATNGTADPTSETGDMKLGASFNLTSNQYFDGDIDNLRIYNRAISSAEVTEIYNLGRS